MGFKNLDRRPFVTFCAGADTVADMMRLGWRVHLICKRCDLELRVHLPTVARLLGPKAELWNRRPRCQRSRCRGEATYYGSPAGTILFWPLTDAERYRKDGL